MNVRSLFALIVVGSMLLGAGSAGGAAEKMMDKKPDAKMMDDKKMSGDKMMSGKAMVGGQVQIAVQHANLAKSANAIAGVKTHLQHVVNCIEGSGGGMFKAMGGNPCEGKGHGILPEAMSANMSGGGANTKKALAAATAGWKATSFSAARTQAANAHAALMKAEKGMMMAK
ncbi:MAG: hypothetical protein FJX78_05640 [Armatimonadetes bacterium]|nr:hypothetical protein [Armatimonadota bacterium]